MPSVYFVLDEALPFEPIHAFLGFLWEHGAAATLRDHAELHVKRTCPRISVRTSRVQELIVNVEEVFDLALLHCL